MGAIFRFTYCQECGNRYRTQVETCKCGKKDFRYSDWYIRVKIHGRNYEKKVGSKTLARQVLVKHEAEIMDGKFKIKRAKKILMKNFVLGEYWELYAKDLKGSKDYWNRIHQQIIPVFGNMYLDQIERKDIDSWIARLKRKNKPATVNRQMAFLKGIFKWAVEWNMIEESPASGIRLKRVDNDATRYLSGEEFQQLIKATEEVGHPLLKPAIVLAVGTMLRRENLFSLQWSDIDLTEKSIRISGELTKSNRNLILPIIDPVFEVLQNLPRTLRCNYVLVNPMTGTRYIEGIRKPFKKAKLIAGLEPPRFRWHDLRCTGASWHVMSGTDLYIVQKLMGHSTPEMTQKYAHLAPKYKKEQAEKISDFFKGMDVGWTERAGES